MSQVLPGPFSDFGGEKMCAFCPIWHNLVMCGRYRLSRRKQIIEEHFDSISGEEDWTPRYNVAPTQPIPIIRQNPKEPVRELSLVRCPPDAAPTCKPADSAQTPPRRDILTLTPEVEPPDRKLGELLLSLDLVDSDHVIGTSR